MNKKQVNMIVAIGLATLTLITSANAFSMTEAREKYINATNIHNEIISHYEKRVDLFLLYSSQSIVTEYNATLRDISTSFSVLEKTHNKLLEEYPSDKNWTDTATELDRMANWLRAYEQDQIIHLERKLRKELEAQYAVLANNVSEEIKAKTINPLTLTKAEGFYNHSQEIWTNATPECPVEAIDSNYYLLEAIDTLSSATGDIIILNWLQEAERLQKKVEQNITYAKSIGVPDNRIPYALYEDSKDKSEAAREYLNIKDREKAHNFANQSLKSISVANIELSIAIREREDWIKSHNSKKMVGMILSLVPLMIGLLNYALRLKKKEEYVDTSDAEIGKAKKILKVLGVITLVCLFYFIVLF